MLLVATQKDPSRATTWFSSLSRVKAETETYKGATLSTYPSTSGPTAAMPATGGVLLVGDLASVKAAIDRNGANGLAANPAFRDAVAGIDGDQVSRTYLDLKRYLDAAMSVGGGDALSVAGIGKSVLDRLPGWIAAAGQIEEDALIGRSVMPHVATVVKMDNRAGTIAGKLPASTIALIETHDVGTGLKASFDELKKSPGLGSPFAQIEQAAGVLGGLDKLVGWMGDVGIVVTAAGATPSGGLVIVPTDAAGADQIFTQLKNLVSLAGSLAGVTVRDDPYADGTITTIDLGDARQLLGTATGGSAGPLPIDGRVQIAFTVQRGLAIVGAGDAFVKSVLDVKAGSSLGDQARYKAVMDRVGTKNVSSVFVDLAAIRKLAEPLASSLPDAGTYATELKPYLEPFDVLASAGLTGDKVDTATFILTVTKP